METSWLVVIGAEDGAGSNCKITQSAILAANYFLNTPCFGLNMNTTTNTAVARQLLRIPG